MKKKLYFFIFFIVIIGIVLGFLLIKANDRKDNNLKEKEEFAISKIHYYSTANAISNSTNYQNPEWNLKVYQYTDIAIYIDRLEEAGSKNYISSLEISNVKLNKENEEVYYLNPMLFGKSTLNLDFKLDKNLDYNIINSKNSENEQGYNIPIFFQDCSNPITLRFVNYLNDNYKVSSENSLIYNGSLISELGLDIDDLEKNLEFDLTITTKDGKKRVQKVELEIPFEKGNKSILDGDFELQVKQDIKF